MEFEVQGVVGHVGEGVLQLRLQSHLVQILGTIFIKNMRRKFTYISKAI